MKALRFSLARFSFWSAAALLGMLLFCGGVLLSFGSGMKVGDFLTGSNTVPEFRLDNAFLSLAAGIGSIIGGSKLFVLALEKLGPVGSVRFGALFFSAMTVFFAAVPYIVYGWEGYFIFNSATFIVRIVAVITGVCAFAIYLHLRQIKNR